MSLGLLFVGLVMIYVYIGLGDQLNSDVQFRALGAQGSGQVTLVSFSSSSRRCPAKEQLEF